MVRVNTLGIPDADGSVFAPDMPDGLSYPAYRKDVGWHDNQALYAVPIPPPAPTIEEYTDAVQAMLDAKARERGYDGILSLASYAASTNPPFAAEGDAGLAWRDAVWLECYSLMAQVEAGTLPQPTIAELLEMLPTMDWPPR